MASKLKLYSTDFCPFAQRFWLAALEKEDNPSDPQHFDYTEVNYFNPDLEVTQAFLKIHNTVPAGVYEGKALKESMPMCYWVDETFPSSGNRLQPASVEGVAHMKAAIAKYTSGQFDLVATMYAYMFKETSDPESTTLREKLLAGYAELARDLVASGGPYLLGEQFTLADVALIPFVDRCLVVNGHYKQFAVPTTPEYAAFHAWRSAYQSRPAYQLTNADRLPRSLAVQPFAAVKRDEYIVEMYEGYANNVREEARAMLRHAPPGVRTVDVALAKAQKAAKEAEKKAIEANHVAQSRLLGLGLAALVGAAVIAKVVSVLRKR